MSTSTLPVAPLIDPSVSGNQSLQMTGSPVLLRITFGWGANCASGTLSRHRSLRRADACGNRRRRLRHAPPLVLHPFIDATAMRRDATKSSFDAQLTRAAGSQTSINATPLASVSEY